MRHVYCAENVDDEHCTSLSREALTPVNEHLGVKGMIGKKAMDALDNPLHLSMSTPCHQQLPAFKGGCLFLDSMQSDVNCMNRLTCIYTYIYVYLGS